MTNHSLTVIGFPTLEEAEAFADRIHKWMITHDYNYAHDAAYPWNPAGRSKWATPHQVGEEYFLPMDHRSTSALTQAEYSKLKESL